MTDRCDKTDLLRDQCAHCGAAPGIGFAFLHVSTITRVGRGGRNLFAEAAMPVGDVRKLVLRGSGDGTTCACGQPTRDNAYGCDDCADELRRAMADATWWAEQLELTMTKQQGTRPGAGGGNSVPWYTRLIGGVEVEESTVHFHEKAADLGHALRNHLVTTVRLCVEEGVRHSSPYDGLPENTIEAMSTWLLWRVDGLMWNPAFTEVLRDALQVETSASWLIDRAPDRIFLGPCKFKVVCGGVVYAKPGEAVAKCRACGETYDVVQQRTELEKALDDRLCTAAEIAKLATYLGIPAERSTVRERVNRWHSAGVISASTWIPNPKDPTKPTPRFRYGDVLPRLAATYQRKD